MRRGEGSKLEGTSRRDHDGGKMVSVVGTQYRVQIKFKVSYEMPPLCATKMARFRGSFGADR